MEADHVRDAREAKDEFAECAQCPCPGLVTEVAFDVTVKTGS